MSIAREIKSVLFCLVLFGALPVTAGAPGDIPEATARLLTSNDPQLVKFGEQSLRVAQIAPHSSGMRHKMLYGGGDDVRF